MIRIKTSEANKLVVERLKSKFQFKELKTMVYAALAYSIQLNKKFNLEEDTPQDNKGFELPADNPFGAINYRSNVGLYRALLNQHYGKKLTEEEFAKLAKMHIDHGLEIFDREILKNARGKNTHIDYLLRIISNGSSLLSSTPTMLPSFEEKEFQASDELLELQLGTLIETGEPVHIKINDVNEFDSQHIAIAGMIGSGKTELIKDILLQIHRKTSGNLKYIFFDYKGEGQSGKLKPFLEATSCEFIDIQNAPFEFNPLSYINLANERARDYNIRSFRDSIASIDKRIGVRQKSNLEIAIKNCYSRSIKAGSHPTIQEVNEELSNIYEESKLKPDMLTAIIGELAGGIFDENTSKGKKIYNNNLYINLPPTLSDSVRQAAVFLTLNYLLSEFISYNDVKIKDNRIKPLRYVIVIDEAHVYLKSKNMSKVLEDLLRMIRSKGVVVVMLSQGVQEYRQKDFDFASQVKIPILLNVQDKDIKLVKSFLGSPRSDHSLQRALKELEGGKGVINFKEPQLIELNQFWKTMKK